MLSVVIPHYNASEAVVATVGAVRDAARGAGTVVEILVVDDGSRAEHVQRLRTIEGEEVRVLAIDQNTGRAACRNRGVQASNGRYLLFLDCDCRPVSGEALLAHMRALAGDADVSVGSVTVEGKGVWVRYRRMLEARRATELQEGRVQAGSAENLAVERSWLQRIGGFDEAYSRYGFEDRDLLLRLRAAGARIVHNPEARVSHQDRDMNLVAVTRKMQEAGQHSAGRFRECHPDAYRRLGYGFADAELHAWLRPPVLLLGPPLLRSAGIVDRLLARIPFPVARHIIRFSSALAFGYGTACAARQPRAARV